MPVSDTIDDKTRNVLEHWHDDMQGQMEDEVDSDVAGAEVDDADLAPPSHEPSEEELSSFDAGFDQQSL